MTCWNDWVARFISNGATLGVGQDRSRPKFDAMSIWIDGQSSRTTAFGKRRRSDFSFAKVTAKRPQYMAPLKLWPRVDLWDCSIRWLAQRSELIGLVFIDQWIDYLAELAFKDLRKLI